MRRIIAGLLVTSAFILPAAALAQPMPDAADPADAEPAAEDGDIVVLGRGDTRQVQELDNQDITILSPGTSPLKAIARLPGVNFQSADAFGAYEWAQRVSIRGFNQNQIGFTLDGIPLGDGSYGNTNGLHISRAIIADNIRLTRVSQGAGSIGTQATNNLGGTIEFFSDDPASERGVRAAATYGDENTYRVYARLDTGDIGGSGVAFYGSYARLDTDKWKGFGSQRQDQFSGKLVAPITGDLRAVGTLSYSVRRENDYQDMSLDMIRRLGSDWDNISDNYELAVLIADIGANTGYTGAAPTNPAAGTTYPAPFANPDDAYFDAAGLRDDLLASFGVETPESAPVRVTVKGYLHDNKGQGLWFTPYVPTPGGIPISIRTTEYDIDRKGVFGSAGGTFGDVYDLTVGGWYEKNDFRQARRFYGLASRNRPGRDSLSFQANPFFTQWDYNYETETVQYFVQNKLSLGALTVNLGWKGYKVENRADPIVAGALASGEFEVKDWFQPHAGVSVAISDDLEVFGGFTQVTRAFTSAATSGPFATTPAGFAALGDLKPEQSDTFELGGRFRSAAFSGSVGAYYVNFRDRLIAFANGAGIVGNPAILQNVGDVRSLGIEATGEFRLGGGLSLQGSYAYNESTYRDDVLNAAGAVVAATEGRTVVDAPRHIASAEIVYSGDIFFGRFGGNYMSKRYFTYENDQSVDGRLIADATLGARIEVAPGRQVELQLNATNLFDEEYVATIGSNGFGNRGDNQTLLIGAPRQVFVTLKTGF
ncbi:TonB-dependent receptor [Sphingomonas sp. FW199]|uniref:TonB-dependent receptor n=1 Tax=Sphingomonas sp. FW199 TaxID=3400217 RepID=UPI003CE97623